MSDDVTKREKSYARAKRKRARDLAQRTEIMNACACEFPLVKYRNYHCHGRTLNGEPCPAIVIIERIREEREEHDSW